MRAEGVKSAAETFRANPGVDVVTAITELKVDEALVSVLMADGVSSPVERTLIKPACWRVVGPVTAEERKVLVATDAIGDKYDTRNCFRPRPPKPQQQRLCRRRKMRDCGQGSRTPAGLAAQREADR